MQLDEAMMHYLGLNITEEYAWHNKSDMLASLSFNCLKKLKFTL
jgi:hypothetical protein